MERKIVYIACQNLRKRSDAEREIQAFGYRTHTSPLAFLCQALVPKPIEFWQEQARWCFGESNAVLAVPPISKAEIVLAHKLNLPVFYNMLELKNYIEGGVSNELTRKNN